MYCTKSNKRRKTHGEVKQHPLQFFPRDGKKVQENVFSFPEKKPNPSVAKLWRDQTIASRQIQVVNEKKERQINWIDPQDYAKKRVFFFFLKRIVEKREWDKRVKSGIREDL